MRSRRVNLPGVGIKGPSGKMHLAIGMEDVPGRSVKEVGRDDAKLVCSRRQMLRVSGLLFVGGDKYVVPSGVTG